ncbi:MAG: N-acetylmuramoyl-L-alanine amidase [Silvibacterium sp.]
MPASIFHAGRLRLLTIAGLLCLFSGVYSSASSRHHAAAQSPFAQAQQMREALEGMPEQERTHSDYERVMNAYRAIYHSNPSSPHADASVVAVAELLAEDGRVFHNNRALRDAVGQYVFLRTKYPQSSYCESALLTTGKIYLHDLNDPENARSAFVQFLQLYPQSSQAAETRVELRNLSHAPRPRQGVTEIASSEAQEPVPAAPRQSQPRTGSDAGLPSQQRQPSQGMAERDLSAATESSSPVPSASPSFEPSNVRETDQQAPSSQQERIPLITGIRYWSTPVYTRVAIDLQDEVRYEAVRVPNPDRIFFDFYGTHLSPTLSGKSDQVIDDGFLKQIRAAQFSKDVTRIVLDVSNISDYSAFFLPNPPRLIIDVHGTKRAKPVYVADSAPPKTMQSAHTAAAATNIAAAQAIGLGPDIVPASKLGTPLPSSTERKTARGADVQNAAVSDDVASLSSQPNRVRATLRPTMAPVAQSVAGTSPAPQPDEVAAAAALASAAPAPTKSHASQARNRKQNTETEEAHAAPPTAEGEPTLVRTLGLKINRIVIDAGHGGHDSGTLGPGGIEEKNVVLDVALRLGALLKQKLGADIIYTRDDDTFIPLETRTAIANKAQADLFISIHANSSSDPSVRGVEVYYLNFTTSADALGVAARENAVSDQSIHQLSELVRKIALQDKINESREFAADVDQSLYAGLEAGNPGLKDRGVKKAPFVVLIGANMPSILAEISFLTSPESANDLREPQYRERIAESLYRGVARYVDSLNGVRLADASPHSAR